MVTKQNSTYDIVQRQRTLQLVLIDDFEDPYEIWLARRNDEDPSEGDFVGLPIVDVRDDEQPVDAVLRLLSPLGLWPAFMVALGNGETHIGYESDTRVHIHEGQDILVLCHREGRDDVATDDTTTYFRVPLADARTSYREASVLSFDAVMRDDIESIIARWRRDQIG